MHREAKEPPPLSEATLPLPLHDALAMAGQIARALAELHARGLVHAALRPQAIGWHAAGARPGVATLLESEAGVPAPARAALPAGAALAALVYVAPEQTGRIERAVDARSDLYALGVVLYEVLTGAPPFVGRDALEQIHWHIAGQPVPPHEHRAEVPPLVSRLVLKLLAKSPQDRYQSALGLAHDLARCAAAFAPQPPGGAARGEDFVLGEHERGAGLVFGSRLVGREAEVAALRGAFERCCAGARVLMLVHGYAGIGKTALIQQLAQPIARQRGFFIAGKFDQVARGVPFGALIQAFRDLVRQLLGESEERLAYWRERLLEALGANAGVLSEVLPEIEHLIGAHKPPAALGAVEAHNRFLRVVQRFLAALAQPQHPLALFLDDLQWADAATLALLEPLATSPDIGSLLLLGAYRDTARDLEVAPRLVHALAALAALDAAAGADVRRLALAPLAADELAALLGEVLHVSAMEAAPLAQLVHAKTGGNPFFAMQFLRGLERDGQLAFDPALARWRWDLARIRQTPLADNVVDLMSARIQRLGPATQAVLTLAACIGNRFDLPTLATVSEQPAAAAARELAQALHEGLIVHAGSGADVERYAFLHDRVQQAAYALIPMQRRRAVHLAVGRLLRARAGATPPDAELFDIVHHLNHGRELIRERAEQQSLARLNLAAGLRAKSSTAFEAALELFEAGLELAGPAAERTGAQAQLVFELALNAAECRYLSGEREAALASCQELAGRAPSPLAQVRALRLAAVQYENMARYDEAIASARAALALLDIRFATEEAGKAAALGEELQRIERLRAGRAIAALAELPPMNDAGTRMAMSLLVTLWSPAYITGDTTLARLLSATLVRLSLEHGNVGESAYGYVTHAITVGALQADYRAADEYGRLALAVNQRLDDLRLRAKVYQQFHAHVNFWCHPIPSCVPYAREAIAAGLDSGDFVYAGYAAGTELWAAIAAMQDLGAFEREYAPRVALLERLKNPGFADMARLILAWARALQGPPPAAGLPPALGPGFDEAQWLERYGHVRFFACIHAVARLQLALLLGDAQQALSCARRSQGLADAAPGTLWPLMHELWHALALARAAAPDSGVVWADDAARDEALQAIGRAQAAFAAREQHSAVNFRPPALLLEGELARLQGRAGDALLAHAGAAQFAADAGLRLMQALAHEGLARTHAAIGQTAVAALHQQRAAECYRTGGLHGKVAALLAAAARADPPAPTPIASAAAAQGGPTGSAHELDLASVLKAADAIAAEQETDALLARLLHIAIENAGAERGALVLESTEGPVLHSYEAGGSAPLVQALELSQRVPHSIVNYVRHTGETVVRARVAEASHARDEYLHTHAPRSLACLPVRALARTIGVLYLEHRHAEEVFTATRLATLQAIAMLAAIALENTRLVGGLRGEVEERREAQERLYEALTQVQRLKDDLELENSYLRRDLIANVSHDLRTPLVSLRGYVELVAAKGEALPAAEREQYLAIALKQSERLAGLIDELFDLAKLDFKGIRLNRERFAFGELAADVAQKFALAAKSRGVQISVQVGEPLPFVDADLGLVERVLDNLIGNALKHTPEGGRVAVRARTAGSHVLAEVQDSGEGIAAADLPHVFDRFYRGSGGAAAASNGAGLGLAIARRIVELHDGEIGAASAPGGGARLWFTLPVTSAPGAGAAPPG